MEKSLSFVLLEFLKDLDFLNKFVHDTEINYQNLQDRNISSNWV